MRRILLWSGGALALLATAIGLAVVFFSWNWLRIPVEQRLSTITGKHVRITGPIHGQMSWMPQLTFEGLTLDAPDWRPDPRVASIGQVELVVDLSRLLRGTLVISSVTIRHPTITLERRADDRANWDIAKEVTGPSDRHGVPIIGDIIVTDGAISYRDPSRHVTIDGTVAMLKGNGGGGGKPFVLNGKGTYQQAPFTFKLSGDSLDLMHGGSDPYKIDLHADLGRTQITVRGTIDDPIKMTGLYLGIEIAGSNAADLYKFLRIPAPETPPYHLGGTLDRETGHIWSFKDFGGTVGESDLDGSLQFDASKPRLFVSGRLHSRNLNLVDVGLLVGAPTQPDGAASADQRKVAEAFARSDRLFPDAPLNIDAVRNADVDITFTGTKLIAQDLPLENLDLHLKMNDGVLSLDPLRIGVAGGVVTGTFVIDARGDAVKTDADVRFRDAQLSRFIAPGNPQQATASGIIDGRVRFHGTGDTLRKSLATADGAASLIVGEGTISALTSNLLSLDLARAAGILLSGDKQISLRCMVADFTVQHGLMTTRKMAMDSASTQVVGTGTINLADETFDLELKGTPKKATLGLHGPIKVGGTFRHPDIGLGAGAYARVGGSVLLATLLTPIAAVVAFIDSGNRHDADCAALQDSTEANAAKQSGVDRTPPPPKRSKKTVRPVP